METICKNCKHSAITVHDKKVAYNEPFNGNPAILRQPEEKMHCKKFNIKKGAMNHMIECSEFK
jgi:hypothetical protein